MWRRLLDATLQCIGLPLRRTTDMPLFHFEAVPSDDAGLLDVDFVVPTRGGPAAQSLRRCGIEEKAIHAAECANSEDGWRMAGFAASRRRLTCFIEDGVEVESPAALEVLVEAMNRGQDLVAAERGAGRLCDDEGQLPFSPPAIGELLVVRRELLAATGGFDAAWVGPDLQGVDLWIQARRRDFRCRAMPVSGLSWLGGIRRDVPRTEMERLRAKWRSHCQLPDPSLRRAGG
jgi:hypothetical protein